MKISIEHIMFTVLGVIFSVIVNAISRFFKKNKESKKLNKSLLTNNIGDMITKESSVVNLFDKMINETSKISDFKNNDDFKEKFHKLCGIIGKLFNAEFCNSGLC